VNLMSNRIATAFPGSIMTHPNLAAIPPTRDMARQSRIDRRGDDIEVYCD
jgi:hypothetical protein